jgi:hypothetical protein
MVEILKKTNLDEVRKSQKGYLPDLLIFSDFKRGWASSG